MCSCTHFTYIGSAAARGNVAANPIKAKASTSKRAHYDDRWKKSYLRLQCSVHKQTYIILSRYPTLSVPGPFMGCAGQPGFDLPGQGPQAESYNKPASLNPYKTLI